ncbi:MAG: NAD(P)H-hydrate epimerase, partial [Alphaproteobacteria bacterium]
MTELLTAAQMRAIEAAAIASGEVTGLKLMERAGRGVVEAIFEEWPELRSTSHRAVVLCGPGNNGGDGFVVARLLKEWGWEVEVFLYGNPDKLPQDARVNYERWVGTGEVASLSLDRVSVGFSADLCVDALFGTGLARPVASDLVASVLALSDARLGGALVVAVDICSGLCADSGRVLGQESGGLPPVLRPDLTISFHRAKVGHYLDEGPRWSGRLIVTDIGVGAGRPGEGQPVSTVTAALPALGKVGAHKYSHG